MNNSDGSNSNEYNNNNHSFNGNRGDINQTLYQKNTLQRKLNKYGRDKDELDNATNWRRVFRNLN